MQNVVKCVSDAGVYACARCGSHGHENDACCDGGVVVDVSKLRSLSVDESKKIVEFGSGHSHGQLYHRLSTTSGLVVAGGTESYVGTAGLFLGCGRGLLSSIYGLACDNVRAVEYVDAKGELRIASAEEKQDMYWLARGGGGAFPGIVTSFTVQAYDEPKEVVVTKCRWSGTERKEWEVIEAWSRVQGKFTKRRRKMFSSVKIIMNEMTMLEVYCFGCDEKEREYYEKEVRELMVSVGEDGGARRTGELLDGTKCTQSRQSWLEYHESSDLLKKGGMTANTKNIRKSSAHTQEAWCWTHGK